MRRLGVALLPLLLLTVAGCSTGATSGPPADVRGFWVGTWAAPNMGNGTLEMRLEQEGADVTGQLVWRGSMEGPRAGASLNPSGAITGKVVGRTFTFDRGAATGKGDLIVEGDEMHGTMILARDALVRVRRQR
jgi:hypothetical protein